MGMKNIMESINTLKEYWEDVRLIILLSLSLQIFLVLAVPLRKATSQKFVLLIMWSAYMLAQWIPAFGVGLIIQNLGTAAGDARTYARTFVNASTDCETRTAQGHTASNSSNLASIRGIRAGTNAPIYAHNYANASVYCNGSDYVQAHAYAFAVSNIDKYFSDYLTYFKKNVLASWAPFLLLHLGYTDNITAFTLETKEWLKHIYRLIFQVVATLYVMAIQQSFLSIPAILIFIAGVINNVERTCALYLASPDSIKKPNPSSKNAKLPQENLHFTVAEIAKKMGGELNDLEVVQYAYYSYKIFRGLVFDQIYDFREQIENRELFSSIEAENAFRLIEVELNLFYEALQAKGELVHSIKGYISRFLAFGLAATALVFFHSTVKFNTEKYGYFKYELLITYSLLLCAMFQEVMAVIMLVFCDWTFAALMPDPRLPEKNSCVSKAKRHVRSVLCKFLAKKRPRWDPCKCGVVHEFLATPILFRRWPSYLSTYNLIGYCLKIYPQRIHDHKRDCFGILLSPLFETAADIIKKASKHKAFSCLKVVIAKGIGCLCCIVKNVFQFLWLKDLWGETRYISKEPLTEDLWKFIFLELKNKSQDADNQRNIRQLWPTRGDYVLRNGASELMQYLTRVSYDHSLLLWHIATELCYNTSSNQVNDESPDEYGFNIKNYREFSKILSDHMLYLLLMEPKIMSAAVEIGGTMFQETCDQAKGFLNDEKCSGKEQLQTACEQILSLSTNIGNENLSKSVLFDAINLANTLKRLQEEEKVDLWKLLSTVWLEMLTYAAYRCSSSDHAQRLSRSGEFITFVWLLMAHFGLGVWFQDVKIPSEDA